MTISLKSVWTRLYQPVFVLVETYRKELTKELVADPENKLDFSEIHDAVTSVIVATIINILAQDFPDDTRKTIDSLLDIDEKNAEAIHQEFARR